MPDPWTVKPDISGTQIRENASSTVQDVKDRVTSTLGGVADKARQATSDVSGTVSEFADAAVERVGKASDYVRDIDPKDVWSDVLTFVKSRPAESVAAAAVLGFIVGRGARRM